MKNCKKCHLVKPLDLFPKKKLCRNGRGNTCKICTNAMRNRELYRQYYVKNKNAIILRYAKYREKNKEKENQRHKEYGSKNKDKIAKRQRDRRRSDPNFRLSSSLRRRLNRALASKRWVHSSKFSTYIGCSPQFLREFLESKFQPGMNWENHGSGDGKWQIDHIIPLSRAKNEQEIYELSHHTNLQPLWTKDHRIKTKQESQSPDSRIGSAS